LFTSDVMIRSPSSYPRRSAQEREEIALRHLQIDAFSALIPFL